MSPEDFILSVLASMPDQKVVGKKRLQKLAMLLQHAGVKVKAEFRIHNYGPFSCDIADAADELFWKGDIEVSTASSGMYGTLQTVFRLPEAKKDRFELPDNFKDKLAELNKFTTIELEVASTIAFFEKNNDSRDDAIDKTRKMKPTKAIPYVLKKAEEILAIAA